MNGIRYISIQILDLVADRYLVYLPQANDQNTHVWINADKFLSLKALPIKAWDKQSYNIEIEIDGYKITRQNSLSNDSAISAIDFQISGQTAEVEFSVTSYLFRQNHLFNILLQKFVSEHPEVNRLKADLVGTNNLVFVEKLIQKLTGRKIEIMKGNEDIYSNYVNKVLSQQPKEAVDEAVQFAIQHTPMYQSASRFGFKTIENVIFSHGEGRIQISFEMTQP